MKISYRQMSILVMMSFIAVKLMALPGLLYEDAKNMGWVVLVALMLVDFVFALMLVSLMQKNQSKNFYEFLKDTVGIVFAKIVLAVLVVFYAVVLAIIGKGLELFIIQNFYEEFSWFYYGVPLMAVVGFMVYKGIRNISRMFEFFWLPILFACVYIAVKAFAGVEITAFLPMFEDGVQPVLSAGFKYVSWFGSSTFLLSLYGYVEFKDAKKRTLISFMLVAIGVTMLLYFVFYGLFGVTSPTHQFCISDVAQFNGSRSSVGELSWLVASLWIVAQIISFALYSFCMVQAFLHLFNIKSTVVGVLVLDAYIVFWGVWGTKTIKPEAIFYNPITSYLTIVVSYVLPLILVLANAIHRHAVKVKGVENAKS